MIVVVVALAAAVLLWPGRSGPISGLVRETRSDEDIPVRAGLRARAEVGWRGRGARDDELSDLASAAELLAMALRAGATAGRAVEVVAQEVEGPVASTFAEAADRLRVGDAAGPVLLARAGAVPALRLTAGAWTVSEELGVPLAGAMDVAARTLREQVSARRRLEAAAAGPRATMVLLTALPGVGLLAGVIFGLSPWAVVMHSPVTTASTVLGLGLTAAGWGMCRWVLARAGRPAPARAAARPTNGAAGMGDGDLGGRSRP